MNKAEAFAQDGPGGVCLPLNILMTNHKFDMFTLIYTLRALILAALCPALAITGKAAGIGIDIFSAEELTHPQLEGFLDASRKHREPVMIGEMTPRHVGVLDGQKSWDEWFGPMIELLKRRPEIKATAYINWEWREQSERLGFNWHNWGDARIGGNALVRDRWVRELSDPIYLHAPRGGSCPLPAITITPSATSSLKSAFTELATEGGWTSLFNGRDLSGWSVQCQLKDHGKIFGLSKHCSFPSVPATRESSIFIRT